MATTETSADKLRGLILAEAIKRSGEGLLHKDGRPNARAIAQRMGLSHQVIWRILTGRREMRPSVRERRVHEQRITPEVVFGLQRWLGLAKTGDVWQRIERAMPVPPLETTAPRRRPR